VPAAEPTATTVLLAHAGGWDEMLFVLVPLLVFLVLQWLSRRKARQPPENDSR
jgi:hypothetical protein